MKAAVERNGRRGQIRFDERRLSFFVYVRCSFYSSKLSWVRNREVRSSKPRRTEPFGTNSHMLVGDIPLSLRVFCKKRGSACRRSEFIFLSHAGGRRFFGRMGAWRLRRNSDQQGGYHPPTEQHALTPREGACLENPRE